MSHSKLRHQHTLSLAARSDFHDSVSTPSKSHRSAASVVAAEHHCSADALRVAEFRHGDEPASKWKRHGNSIFSETEEANLVGMAKEMARGEVPLTRRLLRELANEYATKLKKKRSIVSDRWVDGFIQRHGHQIKLRHVQGISAARARINTAKTVKDWTTLMSNHIGPNAPPGQGLHWTAHQVVNGDETIFSVTHDNELVVVPKDDRENNAIASRESARFCVVVFAGADGDILYLAFVFRHKRRTDGTAFVQRFVQFDERLTRRRRHDLPYYHYYTSDTGYVTSDLWTGIMTNFCQALRLSPRRGPGLVQYLLLDNLAAHHNPEALAVAEDNWVEIIFFPKNTTHLVQPLDDVALASVKKAARRHRSSLERDRVLSRDNLTGECYCMTVSAAYFGIAEGLTKKAVIKSFYNTGIWPWNPERILGNANITSSSTEHSSFPPADASLERSCELVRDLLAEHLSSTRINCAPTRSVEVHGEPRPLLGSDMERLRRDRERARQEKADRVQAEREAEKEKQRLDREGMWIFFYF
mmetsp:Transcript_3707/g.8975  ORF Transcript_3707/g.8975 Transcript_3707/m.8975 type:complete len:529 (-) Transcript_3707:83-1669(-)